MATAPLMTYRWTGEAMEPLPHFRRRADQVYVVGETYTLAGYEARSDVSHKHEFAWLREAWKQLPEDIADLYPSPDHLRKRSLIDAGYYTEDVIDAGSNASALRVAAWVRGHDEFALVIVRGPIVVIRRAKSQSYRAMDRKEFAASKQAILEIVAGLIGVEPAALKQQEEAA